MWNAFLPGTLSAVTNAGVFTPDGPIRITRMQVLVQAPSTSCGTFPVMQITDGTAAGTISLALNGGIVSTPALAFDVPGGTQLLLRLSTKAMGCKPANASIAVQYRPQ